MKKSLFAMVPIYFLVLLGYLFTAIIGSRVITVLSENSPLEDRRCFVIDAGHGGVDGGAVSCTGVYESHINLQIAVRLDDLMHLLGMDTRMIRTEDVSVYTSGETIAAKKASDLKERVRIVNDTNNGILLSIHQNHYTDSYYSGAQIFYPDTEESKLLAMQLQSEFVNTLNPGSKRQIKKAEGLYLMRNIEKTGVLIECGFLSNEQEEYRLRTEKYQKSICCVIASVCSRFENRSVIT